MAAGGHAASNASVMYEEVALTGENCPSVLLKPLDAAELEIYERLANVYSGDAVHGFVPGFHGVRQDGKDTSQQFLRLENLLHGFSKPMVMDVKLGMRTFLRKEVLNTKARADLFQKMLTHCPADLTSDEIKAKAITKFRYLTCRDASSTSGMFGFRVSGTAGCSGGASQPFESDSGEAVDAAFLDFAKSAAKQMGPGPAQIAEKLVQELRHFRSALETSRFVRHHECVGTSVLLVADAELGYCRVFWIDFAKSCACECAQGLTHRAAPSEGTQEEGLLIGVDNLIAAWESVAQRLSGEMPPAVVNTDAVASNCIRSLL